MTANLSRLLNALGLLAIDAVLLLAFADQLWFHELPCPLCILSRAAFIAAGFGIALNLVFGPQPSHYGLTLLGASAGAAISIRQILLHIVPDTGSYGSPVFGLHLYSWALIIFGLMVVGTGLMLQFDRQFTQVEPVPNKLKIMLVSAFMVFAALAVGNVISTLMICGVGLCPKDPAGYLIFNDNLSLTLGEAP